jgi:phage shock protein A
MALITRISRLFQADLHAVLDRIEEPAVLLRQAVREMEDALAHDDQRMKLIVHEHGQLAARQRELEHSLGNIEEELDICFSSGKEDLARALIKRRLENQRLDELLSRKRHTLEESRAELGKRIRENRTHLESLQQKAELLCEDDGNTPAETDWSPVDVPTQIAVGEDDIEIAFLREKQQRSQR